jgi:uncharacterized protein YodC (DUF2158 family)
MQIGDVAQLKSGGPLVVIVGFNHEIFSSASKAICVWISELDFRFQKEEIELSALIVKSPSTK